MGAWGTSLYANDTTSDIRGDYIDKLRRGKTNEQATQELIDEYHEIMGDEEEEPLFWFALADTQWNYGRLLPEVKEKALFFLSENHELERWNASGPKMIAAWKKTLKDLQEKLCLPQPPEKKVSKYRLYRCPWKLGDVFAYRLSGEYSAQAGYGGKFVVFREVSEDVWWPGHIVPIVQVYDWIGDCLPNIEQSSGLPVLPTFLQPVDLGSAHLTERESCIQLIVGTKKDMPTDNLIYLGNLPGEDLIPFRGYDCFTGWIAVGWETSRLNHKFEHYVIDRYNDFHGSAAVPPSGE